MNISLSSEMILYLEIMFSLAALLLGVFLYSLFRRALSKPAPAARPVLRLLLGRLSFPFVFLLVASGLRLGFFRKLLPFGAGYFEGIKAVFIFFFVVFLIRLTDAVIQSLYTRRHKPYPLPRVLHGIILAAVYLAAFFLILKNILNINITPFLATSAILTAILGLALQGVLSNILAGMSLHFTKSFSRGDWIKVGQTEGVVMDTNWRETRILDRASNVVIIPNTTVASEMITNFVLPDKKTAVTLSLKIGYQAPPALVIETLKDAARETPEVAPAPAPLTYILSYDETGVSYLLKFWVTDYSRRDPITTDVGRLAWYKLKRQGIEIPIPLGDQLAKVLEAYRPETKAAADAVQKERTYRDLEDSSFLRYQEGEKAGELILSGAELAELAAKVRRHRFTTNEVLFKQGESGRSCYLVAAGKVKGEIIYEENGKRFTSEFGIGRGGIVGEMSLFTGMPRTATVYVDGEADLLEIGADAFADLLAKNPGLSEVLADIVSLRNRKNLEFLGKIKELSAQDLEKSTSRKSVLEYLKGLMRLFKA